MLVTLLYLTLWSHGLWPIRLLRPWIFPGKNTGVGSPPFSRACSWPRDRIWVSRIVGRFLTIWATSYFIIYLFEHPVTTVTCKFPPILCIHSQVSYGRKTGVCWRVLASNLKWTYNAALQAPSLPIIFVFSHLLPSLTLRWWPCSFTDKCNQLEDFL